MATQERVQAGGPLRCHLEMGQDRDYLGRDKKGAGLGDSGNETCGDI